MCDREEKSNPNILQNLEAIVAGASVDLEICSLHLASISSVFAGCTFNLNNYLYIRPKGIVFDRKPLFVLPVLLRGPFLF